MMKYILITLFVLSFGLYAPDSGKAQAATYYVSKEGGSDSNPGSITSPWKTIGKANENMRPEDTVYLRAGAYSEPIAPKNNGSPGKYITYSNYQNEIVTMNLSSGAQAALGGHSYIIINGLNFVNANASWIDMTGTTYCIVQNCSFNSANTWGGIHMVGGSNYNKILNCTFDSTCNRSNATGGPKDHIWVSHGSYNLFEGNNFGNAPHVALDIIARGIPEQNQMNIIRNNKFNNTWHTNLNIYDGAGRTLIEGNIVLNAGTDYTNNHCGLKQDREGGLHRQHGIDLDAVDCIIRKNVFINNGNVMMQSKREKNKFAINNRIYNNTFYQNHLNFYMNSRGDLYGNEIKNNIMAQAHSKDVLVSIGQGAQSANSFQSNAIPGSNITYKSTSGSVGTIENEHPSEWRKNIAKDPAFTNAVQHDFHLTSKSAAIDAGSFLTTTVSAGKGTSIPVKDARYFMDGWGIVEGDAIQLQGQREQAKILKVDYAKNVLTVDRSLKWSAGLGVSLPYSGSAPDMGAFESN